MEQVESFEFYAEMPATAPEVFMPGAMATDEGVYVCVACRLPGCELSVLPGEYLGECPSCGAEARWAKV